MRPKLAKADLLIARIAARQHGVITLGQLYWAGLTSAAVKHRVRTGRLHRIHRGVYALGRAELSQAGRWLAAVKACGEDSALSHRSAAALWGILGSGAGAVEVTVPTGAGRARRKGIRVHRSASLTSATTTIKNNIPVTTPRRTLADLRRIIDASAFRDAVRAAEVAGLAIGDFTAATEGTRSELEHTFLGQCRHHRLPEPEVNPPVGRFRADFLWPAQRLIVEVDGYRFHRGAQAFEDDRARDQELIALGYEVLRFTYRQIVEHPDAVMRLVRARLATRRSYSY
jgi:very-short-patch-repair endonuclease